LLIFYFLFDGQFFLISHFIKDSLNKKYQFIKSALIEIGSLYEEGERFVYDIFVIHRLLLFVVDIYINIVN
jgi:hypothetical protein